MRIPMFAALLSLIAILAPTSEAKDVYVRGYYRSNGTYVRPHIRSSPDAYRYNNYGPSQTDEQLMAPRTRDSDHDGTPNYADLDDDNDGIVDDADHSQYTGASTRRKAVSGTPNVNEALRSSMPAGNGRVGDSRSRHTSTIASQVQESSSGVADVMELELRRTRQAARNAGFALVNRNTAQHLPSGTNWRVPAGAVISWETARQTCMNMGTDWRLPTIGELDTLRMASASVPCGGRQCAIPILFGSLADDVAWTEEQDGVQRALAVRLSKWKVRSLSKRKPRAIALCVQGLRSAVGMQRL